MTEILKVGVTKRSLVERAKELQTTGVPTPYEVAAYWVIDDSQLLQRESDIHNLLDNFRISKDREFFHLTLDKAKAIISNSLKTYEEIEQNRKLQKEARLQEEKAILIAEKKRQDHKKREAEAEAAWDNIKDAMLNEALKKAEQVCGTTSKECHITINSKIAKITKFSGIILWGILSLGTLFILPVTLFIISKYFNVDFKKINLMPKKFKKANSDLQKIISITESNFQTYRREHFVKYGILNPSILDKKFIV